MGAWPTLDQLFMVGLDILSTTIDAAKKTITAQIGDVVPTVGSNASPTAVAGSDCEWLQHVGFSSRPSNPTAGVSGAQCVAIAYPNRAIVIGSRDNRCNAIYGSLQAGETCVWAAGSDGTGQARVFLKANGNVSLYTAQGNVAGGQSVTIQCNATDGSIKLASQYGAISLDSTGIKLVFGSSGIQIDSNGVTLIGNALGLNGASVSIGANAVTPAVIGPSGVAGVASTSVKVAA